MNQQLRFSHMILMITKLIKYHFYSRFSTQFLYTNILVCIKEAYVIPKTTHTNYNNDIVYQNIDNAIRRNRSGVNSIKIVEQVSLILELISHQFYTVHCQIQVSPQNGVLAYFKKLAKRVDIRVYFILNNKQLSNF